MPIYEYRCLGCGQVSEIFQGMGDKDDPLKCKHCGNEHLEKILSPSSFSVRSQGGVNSDLRCCDRGVSCDTPKRCCES